MWFVSEGTEDQVESASSIALATHYGVPLSIVTVDATVQYYRRLRTARELTSSKSWTVDYRIVADESITDRIHGSATELSDAANAVAIGAFADIMILALADEGVENSERVQVTHTAPQKLVITASTATTTTTTAEELPTTSDMEEYSEATGAILATIISVIIVLCALAYCCVRYRKSQQRAQEERQDIVLSLDTPEAGSGHAGSLAPPGPNDATLSNLAPVDGDGDHGEDDDVDDGNADADDGDLSQMVSL